MRFYDFISILAIVKKTKWVFGNVKIKYKISSFLAGWVLFLFLAFAFTPSFSQVLPDNNAVSSIQPTSNGNTFTIPGFTIPAGKDALLVIMTRTGGNTAVTQVSYNGANYTTNQIGSGGTTLKSEMWAIPLGDIPVSITGDIIITISSNNFNRGGIAASYKNVNQASPVADFTAQNSPNGSSSSSISIMSKVGDVVVDALASLEPSGPAIYTPGVGQTQLSSTTPINSASAQKISMSQELSSGASVSPSWTITGTANAIMHIGANIQAAYPQVEPDNNATSSTQPSGNSNTFTIPNFTIPAGRDALLVLMTRTGGGTYVTQVSYNGNNYTSNMVGAGGSPLRSEMWAIPLGDIATPVTGDIVVTISANNFNRGGIAVSYKNVNQSAPAVNFVSQSSPNGSGSSMINIGSKVGDMVVDALASLEPSGSATYTPDPSQTQLASTTPVNGTGNQKISMSQKLSAGASVSPTWTISGTVNAIRHIGANIQAVVPQVQGDNNATSSTIPTGNGNTFTIPNFSIPAGNDALLVLMTRTGGGTTVTQVSYNGTNYTNNQIGTGGSPLVSEMWAMPLGNIAASITDDIVVTLSGSDFNRGGIAVSYKNVNQDQPVVSFVSQGKANGSGSSMITIASRRGDMIVDALGTFEPSNPATYTPGADQTQLGSTTPVNAGNKHKISMSQEVSCGNSESPEWTIAGTANAIRQIGANIQLAPPCYEEIPPTAICQHATVQLNAQGLATVAPSVIDNGSSDPCGIVTLSLSPSVFDCHDIGSQTVTLKVIDQGNYMSNCTASVSIVDDMKPVITVTGDNPLRICLGEDYVEQGATFEENCGGSLVTDASAVDNMTAGTYYVTYNMTDINGNVADQVTREVIVLGTTTLSQQGCGSCGEIRLKVCQYDPVPDLEAYIQGNANYISGSTLEWYADNNGSQGSHLYSPPTVSTNQVSTSFFWVEQHVGSCTGSAIRVRVRIKKLFTPDFTLPAIGCGGVAQLDLPDWVSDPKSKATAYTFYDVDPETNPGATPLGMARATRGVVNYGESVIVNVSNGSQTYWVQSTVPNGCGGVASSTLVAPTQSATLNHIPNITVNNGDPVSVVFQGTNATHFVWVDHSTFGNPNIGIIGSIGLNALVFSAQNFGSVPLTARIRGIAYNGNCAGQYQDFTITVNPGGPTRQAQNMLDIFASYINTEDVLLSWDITYEYELLRFEVEKKQENGEYKNIAEVKWTGNGGYQYTDERPFGKRHQYRLKLVLTDGRIIWSEAVEVNIAGEFGELFAVFPNPSSGKFQLKALFPMETVYNWQLTDMMGKQVKSGEMTQSKITIETTRWASGIYYLSVISDDGKRFVKKLILE
jgi:hypothetical protein